MLSSSDVEGEGEGGEEEEQSSQTCSVSFGLYASSILSKFLNIDERHLLPFYSGKFFVRLCPFLQIWRGNG